MEDENLLGFEPTRGKLYAFVISPILFITFSDTCIYWIHRAHHKMLHKPLHKLHQGTWRRRHLVHTHFTRSMGGCKVARITFCIFVPDAPRSYFISLAYSRCGRQHSRSRRNLPFVNGARIIWCTTRDLIIITVSIWCFGTSSAGVIYLFVTAPYNGRR